MDWNSIWLPTATAFGLALLHSLWIGAIIYALVRTCLPLLPGAGARHNLAYGALVLLAVGFLVAFYRNFEYTAVCENIAGTSISLADLSLDFTASSSEQTRLEALQALLPEFAPWLSLVYLFGLVPAALYLLRDQRRVRFLRTRGLSDLPASWSATVADELSRHPATRQVKTYLSNYAGEVMTLGFWSPVIVFPVALVNALSPEMARTILLHEIAHLRHYDHWLNYPQQFIRTFFFYHPVAHGLCRIIDREREHRCDDWVAARCQDRRTYASALITVARSTINPSNTLVMSATKTPFSSRIQRLFHGEEQRGGHAAFSLMFISLLAVGHLSFTSMGADAGAVDCLEEQEKASTIDAPASPALTLEQVTPAVTITAAAPAPQTTATTQTAYAEDAPDATIQFVAETDFFIGTIVHGEKTEQPAIDPLPRQVVNNIALFDTLPPVAKGAPAKQTIKIRESGGEQPLFIIDGVPHQGTLEDYELDPADIKSVSVFKGEAAIKQFGPKGANGVVDITTKNGKKVIRKAKTIINTPEEGTEEKVVIGIHTEGAEKVMPAVIIDKENIDAGEGDPDPIYILDGSRVEGDLNDLADPEEIAEITVLKGASATSIYGPDGINGVIIITTKKGKASGYVAPKPANTAKTAKEKVATEEGGQESVVIRLRDFKESTETQNTVTIKGEPTQEAPKVVIGTKYVKDPADAPAGENSKVVVRGYFKKKAPEATTVIGHLRKEAPESVTIDGDAVQAPEAPATEAPAVAIPGPAQTTFIGENNPIKAYPNPTTGVVNFSNVPTTDKQLEIAVYTPFGELVRQEKFNGSNIDIQGLATGQYLIMLSDGVQRWINNVTVTK